MNYLSVCSGIEAATVAWEGLGWQPQAYSEIEKFPNQVLDYHYPDVPNLGDMNDYQDWPDLDIQVLVGGTPCQSFSVAGLGAGLADPRGNLALVYCGILRRYRPKWFVWENVPGVMYGRRRRDFGAIVGAMAKLGYGLCWRMLDAQYFGLAQRRKRVFIVGCLGDFRGPAEILLEPESLRGDPPPRRETQQDAAGHAGQSTAADGSLAPTLEAEDGPRWGSNQWVDNGKAIICPPTANPLTRRMRKGFNTTLDEGHTPIVVHGTQDPDVNDIAHPLSAKNGGRNNVLFNITPSNSNKDYNARPSERAQAVTTNGNRPSARGGDVVAFAENQRAEVREMEVVNALGQAGGKPGQGYPAIYDSWRVRRLTPLECERVQGFPDGYTDIPGATDSPRYRALGNSMAVPVMQWIGESIQMYEESL